MNQFQSIKLPYNMHTHTVHSHDSTLPPEESCEMAIASGIPGIAITDHADLWYWEDEQIEKRLAKSVSDAQQLKEKYRGKLNVLCGIEMGEAMDRPAYADKLLSTHHKALDVVIGSLHFLSCDAIGMKSSFASYDYSQENISDEHLKIFFGAYLDAIGQLAEKADYDIFAHLTVPLRYINGKYHRNFSFFPYRNAITDILKVVIARDKSLEINTKYLGDMSCPEPKILSWYKGLGGKHITIGTDIHHRADGMEQNLRRGAEYALSLGFTATSYYEKRERYEIPLT